VNFDRRGEIIEERSLPREVVQPSREVDTLKETLNR
jgi:hypothetical protein